MTPAPARAAPGRADEALAELERAVELGPYAFPHINLGLAHIKRGADATGLHHLEQARRLWPEAPEPHFYLGWALERGGRLAEAEQAFERAIARRQGYVDAWLRLGGLRAKAGRLAEARATYRRLLEIDPANDRAVEALAALDRDPPSADPYAIAEIRAGRYAEAVAILVRMRRERPRDPDVLFNLGWAHDRLGRRPEALEAYEALIAIAPTHRQGHFNLAYAYLEGQSAEDWRRAAELFERTLAVDPSYHEAWFHLATAWWKLGDDARARAADRRFLEHGGHEELMARARARLGDG
jgi:tetratricopeptide (TPR) repeat protein